MLKRLGLDKSPTTKLKSSKLHHVATSVIKQATSTQRKHNHTAYLRYLRCGLSQRAQHIRYRPGLSSLGTNLIRFQIHVPHGAIDLQGFRESLKETQDIKDPGQQLQQVKSVKRLGSPLTNLDQPTNRHDTHLKLIWKRFESKQVKQTRPGRITNSQTEVKQATSTQRNYHHTWDTP